MFESGAFWFGVVIGFITYRTLRFKNKVVISDIAAIVGAVGGGAVIALFPVESNRFDYYGIGLAIGVAIYIVLSLLIVGRKGTAKFLDDRE